MLIKSGRFFLSLFLALSFAYAQDTAANEDAAFEAAIASMKKDAEAGDAHAAQQVYMRYAVKGDYEQARRWAETYRNLLTKKAEEGDAKAMLVLGTDYLTGKDYTPPDTEKALEWLQRAGAAGEPSAEFIRGELLARKDKKEESAQAYAHAFTLYTDALGKTPQDATLRYWVGYMQLCGLGTQQNTEAALAQLTPLAEEGHNWACSLLYKTYAEGTLLPRDEAKALGFAARAADATHDGLMAYAVAAAYLQGKVLPKDEAKGEHYLDIAAKANVPNAIYAKAQRLLQKKKPADAVGYLRQAASMGNVAATEQLGDLLLTGAEGLAADEAQALTLLQHAATRYNSAAAALRLARYYDEHSEDSLAGTWFEIASRLGAPEAMAKRGLMHLNPFSGLSWSPTECYRWWKTGSAAGDSTCRLYLNLFYFVFIPLVLILAFGLPAYVAHRLNKRAEK